jgi:DinB family protein
MATSFSIDEAREVLRVTPATMRALLGTLSEPWTNAREPGSWSPADILGHLITGEETDWIPRAKIMLEHGTATPFETFDREAQFNEPPRTAVELLDAFESLRVRNLEALATMSIDLTARGMHPELGEVRLGELLATWAVHDLSHLAQAAETMAKRYRAEVGPWRRFLHVLDREELPSE